MKLKYEIFMKNYENLEIVGNLRELMKSCEKLENFVKI